MPLQLDVVTIEREVFSATDVDMVVAPGTEGLLGILPRHEPLITTLKEGELEIIRGGKRDYLAIGGGFMEVRGTRVVVMADVAEHAEEIDIARAEAARARAEQARREAPRAEDADQALASLRRAQVRLKVARRKRGAGGTPGGAPAAGME
ncbi:F0F1 ATP synthase subunit epsilon [bacterium]|nr:MAG: F0F1 ATP synthase subunit epsilon [bacterium]